MKKPTGQGGFTLVEVMFASVVLAVAILGFSTAIIDGYRSAAGNRETESAARAARDVLEEVRSFARTYGDAVVDEFDGQRRDVPALLFKETNRECLSVSVRKADLTDPDSNLVDVRVSVRWTGRVGERSVSLAALMMGG